MKAQPTGMLPVEHITRSIVAFRGHKVLLDSELAELYGVRTKALNQAVKRNIERFPRDFMFRLTRTEMRALNRSQIVTVSQAHRDPRFTPYVFTEHGSIMAATILNSARAVEMSIYVVRSFVQLREALASNKALAKRLGEVETHVRRQFGTYDEALVRILSTLRELTKPPERPIGFTASLENQYEPMRSQIVTGSTAAASAQARTTSARAADSPAAAPADRRGNGLPPRGRPCPPEPHRSAGVRRC